MPKRRARTLRNAESPSSEHGVIGTAWSLIAAGEAFQCAGVVCMIYLLSGSRRANGFGLALRNWHTKSRTAQFDAFVRTYEGWRWNVRAESQIYDRRSATGRRRAQAVGKRYRSAGST